VTTNFWAGIRLYAGKQEKERERESRVQLMLGRGLLNASLHVPFVALSHWYAAIKELDQALLAEPPEVRIG